MNGSLGIQTHRILSGNSMKTHRIAAWWVAAVAPCLVIALASSAGAQDVTALRINEVLSSNSDTPPPYINSSQEKKFEDMIEIYNPTDQVLSLKGLKLSNSVTKDAGGKYHPVTPWTFPAGNILGKAFVLVFCDGRDQTTGGQAHTDFKLSQGGELVALFKADDTLIDMVVFPRMATDTSYGRFPDGADTFCFFAVPTFKDCSITSGGCS